ncbi:M3 family oligoendopeptidase [soil metagenome]
MATTEVTGAEEVTWDLGHLLVDGSGARTDVDGLLDRADELTEELAASKGALATMDAGDLAAFLARMANLHEFLGRAGSFASLGFATDMADPARGALVQRVQERSTAVRTRLLFFELEWAALADERVAELLADDRLAPYRHYLEAERRYRSHVLTEPEERVLTEKSVTGRAAWGRLFGELTSALEVRIAGRAGTLEEALSRLASPERDVRQTTAEAVTGALAPGLRTRGYLYNTLLHDKAVDDRLRGYRSWSSSRHLANEASEESVAALVDAVSRRYDLPHRWYALKSKLLGVERLADYDRGASLASSDVTILFAEGRALVLDAYASFSPELADAGRRFFDERWVDAAPRPGKRPGAFCSYTVPSVHPYLFLNYTARRRDVLTMAHELGHGLHAWLARGQGVFHQSTPLTLAETASVFGETVLLGRLLEAVDDPAERLALLAEEVEGSIATVFRQTAMYAFEDRAHTARRTEGELSVERLGDLWAQTQTEVLGPAVEVTEGYRTWWSYIPHFISTPGYVYAYAYGQLLALAVYRRYTEEGPSFVPRYLELLAAGGSRSPEELGRIVGVDLADPAFWDGGLAIVEESLVAAEQAALGSGRLDAGHGG